MYLFEERRDEGHDVEMMSKSERRVMRRERLSILDRRGGGFFEDVSFL
jgi:hypothetical protein